MEPMIFQGRLKVLCASQLNIDPCGFDTIQGKIVPARGPPIFGWEPIFEHNGETLAEMKHDKKNKLSHRYQALLKFQQWLAQDNSRQ
ncbi:uncharacterized protein N7529_003995 [Penicillium soppii]|uniref:uncharacterized protein n=1 Tax=Penicillium soppii TaxID=69789 RepID=UPI002548BA70|nr:uncharacterized protein N7529_003995 [Penicillium soppii]KAJ5871642.1 hypothetical protein N7529_003995 [Penicillium soppii]